MNTEDYKVISGSEFRLDSVDTRDKADLDKEKTKEELIPQNIEKMRKLQEKFYAADDWALLIVIQAMDTAGKDGLIKHVMTGLNPQGTQVTAFTKPSSEELDHDYLWRINKALPRRGNIGIFNRSHYEEVVVARVHDLVREQNIPDSLLTEDIWEQRYRQICGWERYLFENGIKVLKFFLHISPEEQRERLLDRIWQKDKQWKFDAADIEERQYWGEYQRAYEIMLQKTSTVYSPWYVIPADRKWFSRYLVSEIMRETLEEIDPQFPKQSQEDRAMMLEARRLLLCEPGADPYIPEHIRDAGDEYEEAYLKLYPAGAAEELAKSDSNSVELPYTDPKDLL